MIMAERASSAQLEARVRVLENSATRQDTRFDALSLSINELKQQARRDQHLAARTGAAPLTSAQPHRLRLHTQPARKAGFLLPARRAERATP